MKQRRDEKRRRLTTGERVFAWSHTLIVALLVPVGVLLLLLGDDGTTHAAGIVLLILALLGNAVPVSPFLRARVRRREQSQRTE